MSLTLKSFATPQQMEQRSQGEIPASHPFLDTELQAATRQIRQACGWHIAKVETLRLQKVRPHPETLWLPAMQIQTIEECTVDGTAVTGIDFDPEIGWTPVLGSKVDVTFTAGFDEIPADLVTLTLELAAGGLGSPLGISREQAGGVQVSYTRTSGILTPADHDRIAAYKLGWLP